MASPIAESWVYATVRIENQWGRRGSGFLVARQLDADKLRIFLVTNKHVLHEDPRVRQEATLIQCDVNVETEDGEVVGRRHKIDIVIADGSKRWKEHPDQNVDVLAIDITELMVKYPRIEFKWASYDLFADEQKIDDLDITIGEDVLVIGYPLGLRQGATNFPLVRQGILATRIGERIHDEYRGDDGKMRTRILRGFLIDGGVVPGSSGSPVILKPTIGRFVKGDIAMGPAPSILLGIISETKFAPIETEIGDLPSFAGLGLAFDAVTVKETIELFFAEPGPTSSAAG